MGIVPVPGNRLRHDPLTSQRTASIRKPDQADLPASQSAHGLDRAVLAVPQMSDDRETMQRWEALSQKANEAFAGQPMEDVGGALALLTAMLLAGVMQDEDRSTIPEGLAMAMSPGTPILVMNLIPSFLETIEEQGGWDNVEKKGRH